MADPDPKGTAGSPFPGWLGSGELVREADIISLGAGPLDAGPDYGAAGPGPAEGMAAMAQQTALGFAGLLRQLRTEARLTQEELAQAAGLSPRAVSDLERGVNRTARKDTAVLLAGALGVPEPVRDVFVAAARGRAPAVEVLAALGGETTAPGSLAPGRDPVWPGCPYLGLVPFGERDERVFTVAASWWTSWCGGLGSGWTGPGCCWWPGSRARGSRRC